MWGGGEGARERGGEGERVGNAVLSSTVEGPGGEGEGIGVRA